MTKFWRLVFILILRSLRSSRGLWPMGLKIFAFRFVSLCRSISKQQIHSMRGGRVRGWSMLSGIFLHMYCYVLYVISGPHRRAPNGMSWMLNSHKLNCMLCLPNLATASALTLYQYPTVTEALAVVKHAITETLVGLIQVVQRWLEGVMVIRMILFTTKEKKGKITVEIWSTSSKEV